MIAVLNVVCWTAVTAAMTVAVTFTLVLAVLAGRRLRHAWKTRDIAAVLQSAAARTGYCACCCKGDVTRTCTCRSECGWPVCSAGAWHDALDSPEWHDALASLGADHTTTGEDQ